MVLNWLKVSFEHKGAWVITKLSSHFIGGMPIKDLE